MALKSNIVFLYADSLRRDLSTCLILEKALQSRGYSTFICSRRNFQRFTRFVLPSKLLLVGQVEMCAAPPFYQEMQQAGAEIYLVPSEGFASHEYYVLMYPEKIEYDPLKAIFFWGELPRKWFLEHRKITDTKKLVRAGSTRVSIAKQYRKIIKHDGRRVGFLGRFSTLNDIYGRNLARLLMYDATKSERAQFIGRVSAEMGAFAGYLELFDYIVNNTDYRISVRPHPNEDIATYNLLVDRYKGRFEIDGAIDVAEWMSSCKAIIGLSSTAFPDAYVAQTPVICLDKMLGTQDATLDYESYMKYMYMCSYLPASLEELKELLKRDQLPPVATNEFLEFFENYYLGDTEIVFDTIIEAASKNHVKTGIFDLLILAMLRVVDFAMATRHKIMKKKSLTFDYSRHYHKTSNTLKTVSDAIISRLTVRNAYQNK